MPVWACFLFLVVGERKESCQLGEKVCLYEHIFCVQIDRMLLNMRRLGVGVFSCLGAAEHQKHAMCTCFQYAVGKRLNVGIVKKVGKVGDYGLFTNVDI